MKRYERIKYCPDYISLLGMSWDQFFLSANDCAAMTIDQLNKINVMKDSFSDTMVCSIFGILDSIHLQLPIHVAYDVNYLLNAAVSYGKTYYCVRYEEFTDSYRNSPYCLETPYIYSILTALLAKDETSLQMLAKWIKADSDCDDEDLNLTEMDTKLFYLICQFVQGVPLSANESIIRFIEQGRRKRPKMLLDVFKNIESEDKEAFIKYFKSYLDYFIKNVKPRVYCCDFASIMWALAERKCLISDDLEEIYMDRIITRNKVVPRI